MCWDGSFDLGGHLRNLTRPRGSRGVPINRGLNAEAGVGLTKIPSTSFAPLRDYGEGEAKLESRHLLPYPWLARTHEFQP